MAHQVRNLEGPTIALAGNFVSRGQLEIVRQEVLDNLEDNSNYQEVAKTILQPGFDTAVDINADHDLSWQEFKRRAGVDEEAKRDPYSLLRASHVVVQDAGCAEANGRRYR